jgi:hypothetical protein
VVEICGPEPLATAAAVKSRLSGLLQFRGVARPAQAEVIVEQGETRSTDCSILNYVVLESPETTFDHEGSMRQTTVEVFKRSFAAVDSSFLVILSFGC